MISSFAAHRLSIGVESLLADIVSASTAMTPAEHNTGHATPDRVLEVLDVLCVDDGANAIGEIGHNAVNRGHRDSGIYVTTIRH
jgi:hypothetical protein